MQPTFHSRRAPMTNGLNTVRKQYTEAGSKLKIETATHLIREQQISF